MKRILFLCLLAALIASAQTSKKRATITRERHEPQKTVAADSSHQSNRKKVETVKQEPRKQEPKKQESPKQEPRKQEPPKQEPKKQEPPKPVAQQSKSRIKAATVKQEPKKTNVVNSEPQKQTVNKSSSITSINQSKTQTPVVTNYNYNYYTPSTQRIVVVPSTVYQQTIIVDSEQQVFGESSAEDAGDEEELESQEAIEDDYLQVRQRVAVLPSVGELDPQRMNLLTDKIREIVTQTLPTDKFALLRQDALIEMIGEEEYFIACKEGACIGELAKKANANYGMRCDILKIDDLFVLKFELYSVKEEETLEIFTDYNAKDFFGMIAVLEERLPIAFKKITPDIQTIEELPKSSLF